MKQRQFKCTESEIRYLERNYIKQPVTITAKHLGRTENSVKHKASKLGICNYKYEYINATEAAKCFGISTCHFIKLVDKGLPYEFSVMYEHQNVLLFSAENIWKWMEENKHIINWAKYKKGSLLPEPQWLNDAIAEYTTPNKHKRFSESEINNIKIMQKRGMTNREIATILGRTYYSVKTISKNLWK